MKGPLKRGVYISFAQRGQMVSVDDTLQLVESWADSQKYFGDRFSENSWGPFSIKKLHSILD
jgi:hypothetical protein